MPAQPAKQPAKPESSPAKLAEEEDPSRSVSFRFAPEKIKIGHSSDTNAVKRARGLPVKKLPPGRQVVVTSEDPVTVEPGDTTLSFGEIILDGAKVVDDTQTLLRWTHPVVETSFNKPMKVPVLVFTWLGFTLGSPYSPLHIVLTKVDIEYTRFTSNGTPTRATVTMGAMVKAVAEEKQNPTSGGDPDRGGRRVIAGDNIQSIARERYGDPRRWRQIADLNGIDDPLRVRPGDMLYLPGIAELGRTKP